jgi:2-amino-4-hydroxy-6-hydroxymethyldihydropteridine diphosphokinase
MSATAYIGLGSNLGDRRRFLDQALEHLRRWPGIAVERVSSYYETAPVGGPPGQGKYLNAAAKLQTDLEPRPLLKSLLDIEQALGRVRGEKDGPRIIDLDLLLYDDRVCRELDLVVPHPRLQERLFVLHPLVEIAPEVVHPVLGKTVQELRQGRGQETRAQREGTDAQREGPGCELTGLRALVTGSSSGIGRAIALELACGGADVIVHRRAAANQLEEVGSEIESLGVRNHLIRADLRDPVDCRRLVDAAWGTWDGLDIWINNAGADTLTGEAARWPFERKLAELWAVDVAATMLLSRDVGNRMKAQGHGVIVNMGWDQAETGMEGDSGQLFAAAKGAVMAFTRSLALTLAPEVRVNCLAPGWIQTAWGEKASPVWQERVERETPLGRWGKPEDVAAAARWLVSPAASFITGQAIRINGGAVR